MPLDAAAGGISLAEHYAAEMLAASAAFRTLVGAANAAAARQRIYFDALPPPEGDQAVFSADELARYRPFAIVFTPSENSYRRVREATGTYVESGQIGIHLEANVPGNLGSDDGPLMRSWKNTVGQILDDLEALAYEAGYLAVNTFEVLVLAREAEDAIPANGDNVFAMLRLTWGAG